MVKLSQQATVVALAAALPVLTSTYKFRMLDSVILALAGALAVYNVNCLTRGNCNAWATLVAVSFFITTLLQFKNYEGQEPAYTKYTKLSGFTLDLNSLRNMLTNLNTDFESYVTKFYTSVYNYMVELYNNIIDYDKFIGLIEDSSELVVDIKEKATEIANKSFDCATGNQKNEIIATNENPPAKKSTIKSSAVSLSKPVAVSNSVSTTVANPNTALLAKKFFPVFNAFGRGGGVTVPSFQTIDPWASKVNMVKAKKAFKAMSNWGSSKTSKWPSFSFWR